MPLPWVRFDTAFPRNHKILALVGDREFQAIVAYVCGLAYTGEQGTDGFLPREVLPWVHARKRDAGVLTAQRLWIPDGPAGWTVNGWKEFQPSSTEAEERSRRARDAALVRWGQNGTGA